MKKRTRRRPDETHKELCVIAEDQARSTIKLSSFSSMLVRDSLMPEAHPPIRVKPRIIPMANFQGGIGKTTTGVRGGVHQALGSQLESPSPSNALLVGSSRQARLTSPYAGGTRLAPCVLTMRSVTARLGPPSASGTPARGILPVTRPRGVCGLPLLLHCALCHFRHDCFSSLLILLLDLLDSQP
jgi:hypothetical protein